MNIQAEKIQLAKSILDLNSDVVLKHLMAVLGAYKTDLWDELSETQKTSVKKAKAQLAKGEGRSHEQVMTKYKRWLTK